MANPNLHQGKFCKDCKHVTYEGIKVPGWELDMVARCVLVTDPVDGEPVLCDYARSGDECGPEGKLYEGPVERPVPRSEKQPDGTHKIIRT